MRPETECTSTLSRVISSVTSRLAPNQTTGLSMEALQPKSQVAVCARARRRVTQASRTMSARVLANSALDHSMVVAQVNHHTFPLLFICLVLLTMRCRHLPFLFPCTVDLASIARTSVGVSASPPGESMVRPPSSVSLFSKAGFACGLIATCSHRNDLFVQRKNSHTVSV